MYIKVSVSMIYIKTYLKQYTMKEKKLFGGMDFCKRKQGGN